MKKKLISVLLLICLVGMYFSNVAVATATPEIVFKSNNRNVAVKRVGETFTVDVSLANGMENQEALTVMFTYDPTKLELIPDEVDVDSNQYLNESSLSREVLPGEEDVLVYGMIEPDESDFFVAYDPMENEGYLATSGDLAHLNFRVLESGSSVVHSAYICYTANRDDTYLYANENEQQIKVIGGYMGDVNKDNTLDILDCASILAHLNGTSQITDADSLILADANEDNTLDILDCARVLAHLNGTNPLYED